MSGRCEVLCQGAAAIEIIIDSSEFCNSWVVYR